jgi:hypothetical protein
VNPRDGGRIALSANDHGQLERYFNLPASVFATAATWMLLPASVKISPSGERANSFAPRTRSSPASGLKLTR